MKWSARWWVMAVLATAAGAAPAADPAPKPTPFEVVLATTQPLKHPQGERPPLFLWTPNLPANLDDAALEKALLELKSRGIALYHRWGGTPVQTLATYQRIGLLQKKLGMPIAVDATGVANGVYTGDAALSHVDKDGKAFRDTSFFWNPGCPFTIGTRYAEKQQLMTAFAKAYQAAGLTVDWWAADWEFDGPNEWKNGWAAARQCTRCRERIPDLETGFLAFQQAVRKVRSELQLECFVKPMQQVFPKIKIGNYAMAPHDGQRYWWDFYEEKEPGEPVLVEGVPYVVEQNARYRPWAEEFAPAGYTVAMPVLYTWYTTWRGYHFEDQQFRWFRNLLLEASAVGANTLPTVPLIPFVHWETTNPPKELPAGFQPMKEELYRELLWHALLRGADSFAMWSPEAETAAEVKPVHEVYAAALEYADFLNHGRPLVFTVPTAPGPVVSGLELGGKVLVRRTDFTEAKDPVKLKVGGKTLLVPRLPGQCAVLALP